MMYRFEIVEKVRIMGTKIIGEIIRRKNFQIGAGVPLDYYDVRGKDGVIRSDIGGGHLQKLHSLEEMVRLVEKPVLID
jgi:hypothetical protein